MAASAVSSLSGISSAGSLAGPLCPSFPCRIVATSLAACFCLNLAWILVAASAVSSLSGISSAGSLTAALCPSFPFLSASTSLAACFCLNLAWILVAASAVSSLSGISSAGSLTAALCPSFPFLSASTSLAACFCLNLAWIFVAACAVSSFIGISTASLGTTIMVTDAEDPGSFEISIFTAKLFLNSSRRRFFSASCLLCRIASTSPVACRCLERDMRAYMEIVSTLVCLLKCIHV